ncbi:MAG: hypothetical protein MMC33_004896 [Icmadophila ericetorum]|nr:hypothetical protein [Icmadophila ericetorum]
MPPVIRQFDAKGDLVLILSGEGTPNGCHFQVSSKHLMLASPGATQVPLPEDNAEALSIILDIVHTKTRDVETKLNWSTLMEIAILVDKYELLSAVGIFADLWFDNLNFNASQFEQFTEEGEESVYEAISMSWVFRRANEFREITKIAIIDSKKRLEDAMDLTLPHSIVGKSFIHVSQI